MSGYRITVTAVKRRSSGRKTLKLRAFQWTHATGTWSVDPDYRRIMDAPGDPAARVNDAVSHVLSMRGTRLSRNRTAWRVERGFDLPIAIGSVILDAVRAYGRHEVDVDNLKVVVSQLGSYITRLGTLTAEPALYTETLRALRTEILRALY